MGIDIAKMGSFTKVTGNGAEIYRQMNGEVKSGGTYHGCLGAIFRGKETKEANNLVRAQFLRSLGDTYGVTNYEVRGRRIKFGGDFLDNLRFRMGEDMVKTLKLDKDFAMEGGYIVSGKPLTERRISAVNRQLRAAVINKPSTENVALLANLGLEMLRVSEKAFSSPDAKRAFKDWIDNAVQGELSKVDDRLVERGLRHVYTGKNVGGFKDFWKGISAQPGVDAELHKQNRLGIVRDAVVKYLASVHTVKAEEALIRGTEARTIREHVAADAKQGAKPSLDRQIRAAVKQSVLEDALALCKKHFAELPVGIRSLADTFVTSPLFNEELDLSMPVDKEALKDKLVRRFAQNVGMSARTEANEAYGKAVQEFVDEFAEIAANAAERRN